MANSIYRSPVITAQNKRRALELCAEVLTHYDALGFDVIRIERVNPGPRIEIETTSPIRQDHIDHWQLTEV